MIRISCTVQLPVIDTLSKRAMFPRSGNGRGSEFAICRFYNILGEHSLNIRRGDLLCCNLCSERGVVNRSELIAGELNSSLENVHILRLSFPDVFRFCERFQNVRMVLLKFSK